MQDKTYHSGRRLRALRELKGLKEKELAESIGWDFNDILLWEENGIPEEKLAEILDFFEISNNLFSIEILNDKMLKKIALNELRRSALEDELNKRLKDYDNGDGREIDLSSLGLMTVPDQVFSFPRLKKINLSDNLLFDIPSKLQQLIGSGCELIIWNNFLDPELENTYNSAFREEDTRLDQQDLLIESIRLVQLRLEHIGIYEHLIINFNDQLTVLIGINGAGKTTILKALSLAILGARDSISRESVLLRNIDTPIDVESRITLVATIDGEEFSNEVVLGHDKDTGEVYVKGKPFESLYKTPSSLKNLILCLGEQRNNSNANEKASLENSPRILDLLPFLRGEDQSCTAGFTSWWANLENSKISNSDDQNTIDLCFKVFSKFMNEDIKSAGLRKVQPRAELWIEYETGKSIPFHLASQGYQAVMGWVGFIIQRMIEANKDYPLPLSQPSIVIIDEIDQLLSIKWQQKILSILRGFFPHTQWIISTHSPMVLTDLDKHQVVQLHERDGKIIAETNEVDLWMWQYSDIIRRYFEIVTTEPKFQEKLLIDEINIAKKQANSVELDKLKERLGKVRASAASVDEFERQLQSLQKREKQLLELMERLK